MNYIDLVIFSTLINELEQDRKEADSLIKRYSWSSTTRLQQELILALLVLSRAQNLTMELKDLASVMHLKNLSSLRHGGWHLKVIKGRKWPPSVFWLFFFSSPFHFFSTLLQWWGDLKTRGCGLHCVMLACLSSKRKDRRNPWLTRLTIFSALTESSVLKDCGLILYLWLNENLMWIMETRLVL